MMAHCHMHLCPVVISLRRKPQGDYSHKLHYIVAIIGLYMFLMAYTVLLERLLLCLGAHAQARYTVVCLCVCVSV